MGSNGIQNKPWVLMCSWAMKIKQVDKFVVGSNIYIYPDVGISARL